jgi:hypothetical protein
MSAERIAAQHATVNACFNAKNQDLSKLPPAGSAHYDYRNVVGNPGIVLLPMDTAALPSVTTRIASSRSFGGTSPLADAIAAVKAEGHVLEAGIMHIIVANLDDGILGQGAVMGNACVIHRDAFGGYDAPAPLPEYAQGKTLVHEMSHVLSLIHTFNDIGTSCVQPHPDIPSQRLPNYAASLADGGKLDNRYRDCRIAAGDTSVELKGETQPYSCLDLANCSSGQYEFFFQFLDYVPDSDMICFSTDQARTMVEYLRTQSVLKLMTSDGGALSLPSSDPAAASGDASGAGASRDAVGAIIGIVFISLSFLLMLIAAALVLMMRRRVI